MIRHRHIIVKVNSISSSVLKWISIFRNSHGVRVRVIFSLVCVECITRSAQSECCEFVCIERECVVWVWRVRECFAGNRNAAQGGLAVVVVVVAANGLA